MTVDRSNEPSLCATGAGVVSGFRRVERPSWNGLRLIVQIENPAMLRSVQIEDQVPGLPTPDEAGSCRSDHPSSGRVLALLPPHGSPRTLGE